jgi:sigma-B regulation protein RsbU (phosphoserine phosphatase)
MFEETRYHEYYLTIERGEMLVLYTDGATEAMSLNGEEFGRERLAQAVQASRNLSAKELIAALHREVIDWTGGLGAHDDITFFVIKSLHTDEREAKEQIFASRS